LKSQGGNKARHKAAAIRQLVQTIKTDECRVYFLNSG